MKNYKDLISICIPVYNNLCYLKQNIKNLYNTFYCNGIEPLNIYISDNCSNDGLYEAMDELKKEYPTIIYNRNDKNLGLDSNIEKVLKMNESKYAWLLGVDDSIFGDILNILDILNAKEIDFMCVKSDKEIADGIYTDKKYIFTELCYQSNWMSADIFSRELISCLDFKKYNGSFWGHTAALMDYNQRNGLKYCIGHVDCVKNLNGNNVSWISKYLEINVYNWVDMVMSFSGYTYSEKLCVFKNVPNNHLEKIGVALSLRAEGIITYNRIIKDSSYFKLAFSTPFFILLVISLIPESILKSLKKIYKMVMNENESEH